MCGPTSRRSSRSSRPTRSSSRRCWRRLRARRRGSRALRTRSDTADEGASTTQRQRGRSGSAAQGRLGGSLRRKRPLNLFPAETRGSCEPRRKSHYGLFGWFRASCPDFSYVIALRTREVLRRRRRKRKFAGTSLRRQQAQAIAESVNRRCSTVPRLATEIRYLQAFQAL